MTHIFGKPTERFCRGCGCTDSNACVTETGPCAWVLLDIETSTGVCSACAEDLDWEPLNLARVGTDELPRQVAAGGGRNR